MLWFFLSFFVSAETLTLNESWERATAYLEDFRVISAEKVGEDLEVGQIKSGLGPTFNFNSEWKGTRKEAGEQASTAQMSLGVKQPLFRGGVGVIGWKKANELGEKSRWSEREKKRRLWAAHLTVFYDALLAQARLKFALTTLEVVKRRQAEIERRYALGRIRKSELLTNTSQFSKSKATQIEAQVRWLKARDQLSHWVGPLSESLVLVAPELPEVNARAQKTSTEWEELRPDLRLLESSTRLAQLDSQIESSRLWPELSLFANHFPWRVSSVETIDNPVRWDVGLQLQWSIPFDKLYQTDKKIAEIGANISLIKYQKQLRLARLEILEAQNELKQVEEQLGEISRARDLSKLALDETNRDFGAGTASLLDIVAQENSYWDVQRQYDELNLQRDLNHWNLKWLQGDTP